MPDAKTLSHTTEPAALPDGVVDAPLTQPDLSAALEAAETAHRRLTKHIEQAMAQHSADVAEKREFLDGMRSLEPTARLNELNAATAASHRALVQATDAGRVEQLRILHAIERRVRAVDSLYASPVAMLAMANLGDPKRSEYQRQLAGAGPAALRQMAALAIARGDRALGAAVLAVVDRVSVSARSFSAQELAEKLVGGEFRQARATIDGIMHRRQSASLANRAFERNAPNSTLKIRNALAKRGEPADAED